VPKSADDKCLVTVTGCVQASSGMQSFTSWRRKQRLMKSKALSDKNCASCNAATMVAMSGAGCAGVHQPSLSLASLKKWGAQQGAAYMRCILSTSASAVQHVLIASQQPPQSTCNKLSPYNGLQLLNKVATSQSGLRCVKYIRQVVQACCAENSQVTPITKRRSIEDKC